MVKRNLHQENRLSWNRATEAHNSHKGDQVAFFRSGGQKLYSEERELLGDISGLDVVHLQCNSGQDTLSLAQFGATVTGVDISDTAIDFARRLSEESGVPATFIRADVFDWLEEAAAGDTRYDIVFCSYGALTWLSDLNAWARGIASILKPGGRLVVVDFHPVLLMFNEDWSLAYDYSAFGSNTHLTFAEGVGDYVAVEERAQSPTGEIQGVQDFRNPHPSHEFSWGIGDIVSSILNAGLRLTTLKEYPYCISPWFPGMRQAPNERWIQPEGVPAIPMMYGIAAQKEGWH